MTISPKTGHPETRESAQPRMMVRSMLRSRGRSPEQRRLAQELVWGWVRAKWPRLMPTPFDLQRGHFQRDLGDRRLSSGTNADGSVWTLSIAYDERDATRTWTTRALVADTPEADAFGLETTCTDRSLAPVVVAPPKVLGAWVDRLELDDADFAVQGEPRLVEDEAQLAAFCEQLLSERRSLPVIALCNRPNSRYYGVDPGGLAEAVRGLAHVACLTPELAVQAAERLGQHLGPAPGAARIYRPGFDVNAVPKEHPVVRDHSAGSPEALPGSFRRLLCHRVCTLSTVG
jgi:hypothetical protein